MLLSSCSVLIQKKNQYMYVDKVSVTNNKKEENKKQSDFLVVFCLFLIS